MRVDVVNTLIQVDNRVSQQSNTIYIYVFVLTDCNLI